MDIVRFKGGLGNQMFQYAFVEALRNCGRDVGCSLGFYKNNPQQMPFVLNKVFPNIELKEVGEEHFNEINMEWRAIKENDDRRREFEKNVETRFFWVEKNARTYYPDVFKTKNCAFIGYWQSEKYFMQIKKTMVRTFEFRPNEKKLIELGEKVSRGYVSIHIRRGDFLNLPAFNVCTVKYFESAIQRMKEIFGKVNFIFISDDIVWVKTFTLEKDDFVVERNMFERYSDWYDMYLMTKCEYGNIVSNSSFSWWGAWLNQNEKKVVIAPHVWDKEVPTPDIWCEDWTKMPV